MVTLDIRQIVGDRSVYRESMAVLRSLRFSLVTVAFVAAVLESGMNVSYKLTLSSHEIMCSH